MKVVLKQDVRGSGKKGQVVEVSEGYARNFLLPKGLAEEANAAAMNKIQMQRRAEEMRRAKEQEEARQLADSMANKSVTIVAKTGKDDKLFGSVTNKEIADALKKQYDIEIDRRKIDITDTIKTTGTFAANLHVIAGTVVPLQIIVKAEEK